MRIINVIEVVDNNVQSVEGFAVFDEQLSQDVVDKAEALFKAKANENGCTIDDDDDEEWSDIIEDGSWSHGNYSVSLVWSEVLWF